MSVDCEVRDDSIYVNAATIDLTEDCNLRCTYCFTSGKTKKELSFETANKILEWLVKKEVSGDNKEINITFWGGEPLVKFNTIKHIVEKGKEITSRLNGAKTFKYGMTTNGTLLTKEVCEYLKKEKIGLLISVDGTKEVHDMFRVKVDGSGSFDDVLRGIHTLKETGGLVSLRLSITPEGIPNLFRDIKWFVDNEGVTYFHFSPVYEHEWTEEVVEGLREQLDLLYDMVIKSFEGGNPIKIRPFVFGVTSVLGPDKGHYKSPCGAGKNYIGISVEGEIYPCHRFHDFCDERPWYEQEKCIGHIDEGFINEHFHGEFLAFTERAKADDSVMCHSCNEFKKGLCRGGCFATNFDLMGSIVKCPEFECTFSRLQIEYGKRLVEYFRKNPKYLRNYFEGDISGKGICRCNSACYQNASNFCECYMGCYNDTMPMIREAERKEYFEDNIKIEILESKIKAGIEVTEQDLIEIIEVAKGRVRK